MCQTNLERLDRSYTLAEVLPHISHTPSVKKVSFDGHMVRVDTPRLRLFALRGTKCVKCGREGVCFYLERFPKQRSYSLGLYSSEGTLLTVDHVIPVVAGGSDRLTNLQVLCQECNSHKSDFALPEFKETTELAAFFETPMGSLFRVLLRQQRKNLSKRTPEEADKILRTIALSCRLTDQMADYIVLLSKTSSRINQRSNHPYTKRKKK